MALCAGGVGVVHAQQTTEPTPQTQQLQRVQITGSNIKRIDAESTAPVEIITRDAIERSGQPTIADVLRNLPANSGGSFGENFTNSFAPGAAGISLRGLGEKTTLVLINGRRTAGYGFAQNLQDSFVDLNSIPSSAVERVEILKDGASAIYGSDAIAGVVNIILRKDFRGIEATAGGGRGAGKNEYSGSLTGGFGDLGSNKFNVFGVFDFYKRDLIQQSDLEGSRDKRDHAGGRNFASLTGGGTWQSYTPNGAGTPTAREVYQATSSCAATGGTVITGPQAVDAGLINLSPYQSAATLTALNARAAATNTFCSKNFDSQFTALPKTTRYGFLGRGTYEVSPTMQVFAEIGLSRVDSFQRFQSPFFAGTTGLQETAAGLRPYTYNINFNPGVAGNPFPNTARYVGVLQDMGTRDSDIRSDSARLVVGSTYSLGTWDFDSAAGMSRNKVSSESLNRLSLSGTSAAFGVPTTPQPPVPISSASSYNLDDTSLNSDAVRDSIRANFDRKATSKLGFIDTRVSTEFQNVKLPGGPLGLAMGVEARHEKLSDDPADIATNGDVLGQGITATKGKRTSEALFAELRLPIFKSLEAQIAGRYDHYSDFGNSTVPKLGFKWTPTSQVAVRGSWGKGFRAPSLPEISDSVATFFTSVTDPEDGTGRQISGVFAGNPNLKPEKSTSYTVGMVFEPVRDASVSVDYYNIKWKNIVASPSFQQIIDDSCPAGGPDCPSTAQVIRNPENNQVVTILSNYTNLSSRNTSGWDIDLRYAVPTVSAGKFGARFNLTYVDKFSEDGTDVAGTNNGSNTIPRIKYKVSLDWDYAAIRATVSANYTHGWRQFDGFYTSNRYGLASCVPGGSTSCVDPRFQNGAYPEQTKSFTTFDVFTSYQVTKELKISGAVDNVFNKKPPYDPGFSTTTLYDFSQFDPRGRVIRAYLTYALH